VVQLAKERAFRLRMTEIAQQGPMAWGALRQDWIPQVIPTQSNHFFPRPA
jgi:hypothetical protein